MINTYINDTEKQEPLIVKCRNQTSPVWFQITALTKGRKFGALLPTATTDFKALNLFFCYQTFFLAVFNFDY